MGLKGSSIFSFVHLSDPHIPKNKRDIINGISPYEKLEKTIVPKRTKTITVIVIII